MAGPASALYGPNSANGVVHILTKSPIGSEGTTVSVAGGERNVFLGSVRHAGSRNDWFGYKLTAQYYQGNDFEFVDPAETEARQLALRAGALVDTLRIGQRDFKIENLALDGRLDFSV